MTITREYLKDFREQTTLYGDGSLLEILELSLIGLAVRDKEPGLVGVIRVAMWRARGEMVGDLRESRLEIDAALSAITAYRSE